MSEYGVNPDGYTVVLKRKSGLHQTDGLTVPKDKKQYVIFLSPSASGAELIRLIAHEVAHVCQIIKGDLEFANVGGSIKVYWHDEEVNVDKVPYRKRPWEVEAYTLEKKYVHDFVNKYGNQLQESRMKSFEEYTQTNEALSNSEKDKHFTFANDKVLQILSNTFDKKMVNMHSRGKVLQSAIDEERKVLTTIWKDEDNRKEALTQFDTAVANWRDIIGKYLR